MKKLQYEYDNGVLICGEHKTPISKYRGHFFCYKCNSNLNIKLPSAEVQNDICTQSTKMDQG
ncbi:hypothetical protein LCGC14_1012830 [marine sediment metagenome]|uniref:Uncharacterized protein n=1 Tax=marine sediment metagenome TaxID=412755 RepID=A0A0F9N4A5_9ZZZZ